MRTKKEAIDEVNRAWGVNPKDKALAIQVIEDGANPDRAVWLINDISQALGELECAAMSSRVRVVESPDELEPASQKFLPPE